MSGLVIFYICCIVAGLISIVRYFISGDNDNLDTDTYDDTYISGDNSSDNSVGFKLSLATICNFFLGFGIGGLIYSKYGYLSILYASFSGIICISIIYLIIRWLHVFCSKNKGSSLNEITTGNLCMTVSDFKANIVGLVHVQVCEFQYPIEVYAISETDIPKGTKCIVNYVDSNGIAHIEMLKEE